MTIDSVTAAQFTGYFQSEIKKILEQGKVAKISEEIRVQRRLEEERKRVQPVYNVKGKLIEYSENGRHLDVKV